MSSQESRLEVETARGRRGAKRSSDGHLLSHQVRDRKPRGRETRQAPVPTGAAELEVKPSGVVVVHVLAKTTAGSHRPSHSAIAFRRHE
jgi:hypothetical protein